LLKFFVGRSLKFVAAAPSMQENFAVNPAPAMDEDGLDEFWGSQQSASGPAHAPVPRGGFDLNSQAPVAEGFSGLQMYGDILRGDDDELLPRRGKRRPHKCLPH
jgi:hypothetical protein